MDIKLLSKHEEPQWSEYIQGGLDSDIYHTLIWRDIINKTYGYEPKYSIALDNSKIVGVMPLFLIKKLFGSKKLSSSPFAYHASMIADNNQVIEALISNAIEKAKELKVKYLELKLVEKLDRNVTDKFKLVEVVSYKLTTLKLTDYESLQSGFFWKLKKDLRRFQKKIDAEDLKFHFDNSEEDLKELWNLILDEYIHKFGAPCGPYKAFKVARQELKDSYKILTVKNGSGKIVAGIIFILFNNKAIDLYSVTHKDYTQLSLSTLLMGKAIKWCCDNNLKLFSFGPSSLSQESLISFKEKWGSASKDMYYYYYPISGSIPPLVGFGQNQSKFKEIYRFLPLPLIKFILPIVAKYMG